VTTFMRWLGILAAAQAAAFLPFNLANGRWGWAVLDIYTIACVALTCWPTTKTRKRAGGGDSKTFGWRP
jgi:hypothetical protein